MTAANPTSERAGFFPRFSQPRDSPTRRRERRKWVKRETVEVRDFDYT